MGTLIRDRDGVYGGQFRDRVKATFVHKPLCRREADATIAAGCERNFPFKLSRVIAYFPLFDA